MSEFECGPSRDHARRKPAVVAGLEHFRYGNARKHGRGGRGSAGYCREAGNREDGGDGQPTGQPAEPPFAGLKQRLRHASVKGEVANQDEQRQHGQRVIHRLRVRNGADHAGTRLPTDDRYDADQADDGRRDIDFSPLPLRAAARRRSR